MFVQRLKSLRQEHKISQKELASKLFLSQQTVAKWETDGATPNPETLSKIADIFGVSVDYLLGRTDEKNPGQKDPEFDVNTIEYALYGEARELDEEEKQQLLELAKLMRKRRKEMMGK